MHFLKKTVLFFFKLLWFIIFHGHSWSSGTFMSLNVACNEKSLDTSELWIVAVSGPFMV